MSEMKLTLEQLFDEYQEKYEDIIPVMQLMGISDEALYSILYTAITEHTPLKLQLSAAR